MSLSYSISASPYSGVTRKATVKLFCWNPAEQKTLLVCQVDHYKNGVLLTRTNNPEITGFEKTLTAVDSTLVDPVSGEIIPETISSIQNGIPVLIANPALSGGVGEYSRFKSLPLSSLSALLPANATLEQLFEMLFAGVVARSDVNGRFDQIL